MKNQKWEYQVVNKFYHELTGIEIPKFLNQKGEEGWELVNVEVRYAIDAPTTVSRRKFYFKRNV